MVEDIPVGKSNANDMFREEMERLAREEASQNEELTFAQKLLSDRANVKAEAFSELIGQLEAVADDDCANQIFAEYSADKWLQYLNDSHVESLEPVQAAFRVYLAKAHQDCIGSHQQELLKILVEKNMTATRPSIKETAIELAVAIFVATESFNEESLATLDELFKNKKSVVVVQTMNLLAGLIKAFGTKRFPIDRYRGQIETMVAATPASQKKAGEDCVRSIYLWDSDAALGMLTKMKAQSASYLKEQLAEFKSVTTDFKVKTRSEQGGRKKQVAAPKAKPAPAGKEESKEEAVVVKAPPTQPALKESAEKTDDATGEVAASAKPAKPWMAKKQPNKSLEDSSAKADSAAKADTDQASLDVAMKEEPAPVKPWLTAKNKPTNEEATTKPTNNVLASVDVEMKQALPAQETPKPTEPVGESRAPKAVPIAVDDMPLSGQPLPQTAVAESNDTGDNENKEQMDPFEAAEPKDILQKFNSAWITQAVSSKDSAEKLRLVNEVATEADTIRLQRGNYFNLVDMIRTYIEDKDPQVQITAVKVAGLIARGLREAFKDFAIDMYPSLLPIISVPHLSDEIQTTLTHFLFGMSLEEMFKPILEGIRSTDAAMRVQLLKLLQNTIPLSYLNVIEDIEQSIVPELLKIADEPGELQELGLKTLGMFLGRLGNFAVQMYTESMDAAKKDKIKEGAKLIQPSKYDKSIRKAAPPVKKKPVVAAKPKPKAKEEEKSEDVEMTQAPAAVKKPPPNIGKKPAPASAAKPAEAKPSSKPDPKDQGDDDSGGLSQEEAIEKINEYFDAEILQQFEDTKWQERQKALNAMQEQIAADKPDATIVEAMARFLKAKTKNWKESNAVLIKEFISTFQCFCDNCERIPKRALVVYSPFLVEKLGDVKCTKLVKDLINALCEFLSSKFTAQQLLKHAMGAKAVNILKETALLLAELVEVWGADKMPVKDCIDFAVVANAHSSKDVRNNGMALICNLYKHMGDRLKPLLCEIKESTLKLINAELEKITPYAKGQFQSSKALKGEAQEEAKNDKGGDGLDLPKRDISKQLTSKLLEGFKSKAPQERQKTCEAVTAILTASGLQIEPNGIGDLMECLKMGMKESNKAVLKANMALLGDLAFYLGAPIKSYFKKCAVPLLFNLSDKQSLVRDCVLEAIKKWSEAIGNAQIAQQLIIQAETENPEMRTYGLQWVIKNKESIKECETEALVQPLCTCLTDKKAEIRNMATELISEVMKTTGAEVFYRQLTSLKPAVQQTVKPILDKCKAQSASAGGQPTAAPADEEKPKTTAGGPQKKTIGGGGAAKPAGPTLKPTLKPKEEQPQSSIQRPQTAVPRQQPMESVEGEAFIINPQSKERRAQIDARTKFVHEEVKGDSVDKLKHLCEAVFGLEVMQKMFSADFKKHLEIIKHFNDALVDQPDNIKEVIDIIGKWSWIKLNESQNMSFAAGLFDFFEVLFEKLREEDYKLWDHEAYVYIPLLCEKSGLNNAILKQKAKKLIETSFDLYDQKKCIQLMFKFGVGSKNLRAVAETIESLSTYIAFRGIDSINQKDLQLIVKTVDSSDKGVRENSLTFIAEIYKIMDEGIWQVLGPLNIKVKGLLEGRFKQLKKASDPMNKSINSSRPSLKPQDQLNRSLTQSLNKSIPKEQAQQTPRRVNPPSTTKNITVMNKSISKKDTLNQSLNSIAQQQQVQQAQLMQKQQPAQSSRQKLSGGGILQQTTPQKVPDHESKLKSVPTAIFKDDDEDLMEQLNELEKNQPPSESIDPKLREQIDFIMSHIRSLKYGDLSKRVDSLVALNDVITRISQYNESIIKCANELCSAFKHVLIETFEKPLSEIPIRFAKYFVTIVNRVCQCNEVVLAASELEVHDLTEQLLIRLLTDGLEKIGENKEGDVILKTLNAAMLRLLENAQPTIIYCTLYNLLRKYRDYTVLPKLPGLVIKCLLKLAKIIEKQTSMLEIDRVLLAIHEYLLCINHDDKSQNDEMGIRITKTVLHELVTIKGEQIWDSYKLVERHRKEDNYIKRWISLILGSTPATTASQPQNPPSFGNAQPVQQAPAFSRPSESAEIKTIIEELRSTDLFEGAIAKLHVYLQKHPTETLNQHLKDLSDNFANFIRTHYEQYQSKQIETGSTPEPQDLGRSSPFAQRQQKPQSALQGMRMTQQPLTTTNKFQPQTNFNASGSGTGRAPTITDPYAAVQAEPKISYQDKLSAMKDKLQKSGSQQKFLDSAGSPARSSNLPPANGAQSQVPKLQTRIGGSTTVLGSAKKSDSHNASFSQMNSSLSQKWKQISTNKIGTQAVDAQRQSEAPQALSGKLNLSSELNQISAQNRQTSAIGSGTTAQQAPPQQATQSDLQTRLAQMKAKIRQINEKQ